MAEDNDDDGSGDKKPGGFRKDGKPYKEGNTRADGSYINGKYRLNPKHYFKKGNTAGKGNKGSKNTSAIYEKARNKRRTIDGVTKTTQEWVVEALARRAIKSSDRAAQMLLDHFAEGERSKSQTRGLTDPELLMRWATERFAEEPGAISDDANPTDSDPSDLTAAEDGGIGDDEESGNAD
jgi:hypothetical protein